MQRGSVVMVGVVMVGVGGVVMGGLVRVGLYLSSRRQLPVHANWYCSWRPCRSFRQIEPGCVWYRGELSSEEGL